jgi:UDP-glucose-4-epimerase GalE
VRSGHEVTVFDNLSTGYRDAVSGAEFVLGDLRQYTDIARVTERRGYDVVMHFAASCYVGESMVEPGKYYANNVVGTINLLEAMRAAGISRLVFSSTCATYGNPITIPMTEDHPQQPVNPYGMSKLASERAMADYGRAYGLETVALRYFNAAGSDPECELGERHDPETHLIPLVLREAGRLRAGGEPSETTLQVFGDDFDTRDGTCVRDYVHVDDLCAAHLAAMNRLLDGQVVGFEAFNLGLGKGFSVREVIQACRDVTGLEIGFRIAGRRPGDPPYLVAGAKRAEEVLDWQPRYGQLDDIIATAWRWFQKEMPSSDAYGAGVPRSRQGP